MQNFGVTNKEYYGMLWYFLEWSIEMMLGSTTREVELPQSKHVQLMAMKN